MGADGGEATAQSIAMKQMNFDSTIEEVSRKPQSLITQDDARVVQSTEVCQRNLKSNNTKRWC
jgi:hypothetical protein